LGIKVKNCKDNKGNYSGGFSHIFHNLQIVVIDEYSLFLTRTNKIKLIA